MMTTGKHALTKHRVFSGLALIISMGGIPKTSTILQSWSFWLAPANRGSPVCISTTTQPSDHMSIFWVYGRPRSTSGER